MPVFNETFEVTDTAVQIVQASSNPMRVELHNHEHSTAHSIYLGDENVTIANGFHMTAESKIELVLGAGDELFAISDHDGGATLRVLRIEAV